MTEIMYSRQDILDAVATEVRATAAAIELLMKHVPGNVRAWSESDDEVDMDPTEEQLRYNLALASLANRCDMLPDAAILVLSTMDAHYGVEYDVAELTADDTETD